MSTADKILSAAEEIFSTYGYEGAAMRLIAERAGVAQALLHYHFKSKEGLYAAVFESRSQRTIGHRGKLLDQLIADVASPTLEDLLGVLFSSVGDASRHEREERAHYTQMVMSVGIRPDDLSKQIVGTYFDPIAQRFVTAFRKALPALDRPTAVWCYLFALGSRTQAQAVNGRASRLCELPPTKVPDPYHVLIAYTAAGIRAAADACAASAVQTPRRKGKAAAAAAPVRARRP